MKKIVVIALAVLMLVMSVLSIAACSKTMKCESCQREEKCTKVTVDGESAWLCSDCKALVDVVKDMADELGDLADLED
jgi:transposase-like protein